MRIGVVGKGGSGKTTVSALLASYYANRGLSPLLIDADLNIHQPSLFLDNGKFPYEKWLSNPKNIEEIKTYLKGTNDRIISLGAFRKTTPPAKGSNIFSLQDQDHFFYKKFSENGQNVKLMVVGTYVEEEIGASCYHNNLSILENILSHTDDKGGVLIVDMVAGVDAFAGSLHAQFDLLLLVLEPTRKSVDVWSHYYDLAQKAGISDHLMVVGNKCLDKSDFDFLSKSIPGEKLVGSLGYSTYLKELERNGGLISFSHLEEKNQELFSLLAQKASDCEQTPDERLERLYVLHHKYVNQEFIRQRFGDLTNQVDLDFKFPTY